MFNIVNQCSCNLVERFATCLKLSESLADARLTSEAKCYTDKIADVVDYMVLTDHVPRVGYKLTCARGELKTNWLTSTVQAVGKL